MSSKILLQLRFLPRTHLLALSLVACVCVTALSISVSRRNATASFKGTAQAKREPRQVVRFTLYPEGIYPREAHISQGLVVLSVEDLSGGAGFTLSREDGNGGLLQVVKQFANTQKKKRSSNEIRLAPGQYQIADAGSAKNTAILIVGEEKIGSVN